MIAGLDLNSLRFIEINIDGKLVVSEFIEPEQQSIIYDAIEILKAELRLSNSMPITTSN